MGGRPYVVSFLRQVIIWNLIRLQVISDSSKRMVSVCELRMQEHTFSMERSMEAMEQEMISQYDLLQMLPRVM